MAKYLRYESGDSYRYGRLDGMTITPLDGIFPNFTPSKDPTVELGSVKLLAPTVPTRIVSAGPGFKNGGDPAMAPTITSWASPTVSRCRRRSVPTAPITTMRRSLPASES